MLRPDKLRWDARSAVDATTGMGGAVHAQTRTSLSLPAPQMNASPEQGKVKYEFLCRQSYGNLLHKAYVKRGPPLQAFAALHAPDDSPVTLATR